MGTRQSDANTARSPSSPNTPGSDVNRNTTNDDQVRTPSHFNLQPPSVLPHGLFAFPIPPINIINSPQMINGNNRFLDPSSARGGNRRQHPDHHRSSGSSSRGRSKGISKRTAPSRHQAVSSTTLDLTPWVGMVRVSRATEADIKRIEQE